MMKIKLFLLLFLTLSIPSYPNADYSSGSDYAKKINKDGINGLRNSNKNELIPNYTESPDQKGYYKGVKSSDDSELKKDASNSWGKDDVSKSVNENISNNEKEDLSWDAAFISNGNDIKNNSEKITSGLNPLECQAVDVSKVEYTNYICEKDPKAINNCYREASIVDKSTKEIKSKKIEKEVTLSLGGWEMRPRGWKGTYNNDFAGKLISVRVYSNNMIIPYNSDCHERESNRTCMNSVSESVQFMGKSFPAAIVSLPNHHQSCSGGENDHCNDWYNDGVSKIDVTFMDERKLSGGEKFEIKKYSKNIKNYYNETIKIKVVFEIEYEEIIGKPELIWTETCTANKQEEKLVKSTCIVPGGEKEIISYGRPYKFKTDCWKYKDEYLEQEGDSNTCDEFEKNKLCTIADSKCNFTSEITGMCLNEKVTYSCETKKTGTAMVCGNEVFCKDGACEEIKNGNKNDFHKAISELAAVASAGEDISKLNDEINVKAFTGKAVYCRKSGFGFSDCCKNSGWGNDIGLAQCNGEEKAIGRAKQNKIIISVGEFCSKKVLGVCLQKKRSYCQFDSKLAQIVQEQGRAWQLGIGFGRAKSPDCRGITPEELQKINFDKMDFHNFYDDLMSNQQMPDSNDLIEKIKKRIKEVQPKD